MQRNGLDNRIEAIVKDASREILSRTSVALAGVIGRMVAKELTRVTAGGMPARGAYARRQEVTRWTADRGARRVPNFVIEQTGLETKKAIVAKFGEVTFERGKPLPKPRPRA